MTRNTPLLCCRQDLPSSTMKRPYVFRFGRWLWRDCRKEALKLHIFYTVLVNFKKKSGKSRKRMALPGEKHAWLSSHYKDIQYLELQNLYVKQVVKLTDNLWGKHKGNHEREGVCTVIPRYRILLIFMSFNFDFLILYQMYFQNYFANGSIKLESFTSHLCRVVSDVQFQGFHWKPAIGDSCRLLSISPLAILYHIQIFSFHRV